jgi:sugar lactone lactonase YvrE
VTPGGKITLMLGPEGDGQGAPVDHPSNVAVDSAGNLYVASQVSYTVHKVTPTGEVTTLVNGKLEDVGYEMRRPNGLAIDASGNVFTVGAKTNNALRIAPDGSVIEIASRVGAGDGHGLHFPNDAAVDAAGNLYICGNNSANVLRVKPTGEVDQLAPPALEGMALPACSSLDVQPDGTVYFTRLGKHSLWRVAPDGTLELLLDRDEGWGPSGRIATPRAVAIDRWGNLFVSGFGSHRVYRLDAEALGASP